jgi:hypothetical protein
MVAVLEPKGGRGIVGGREEGERAVSGFPRPKLDIYERALYLYIFLHSRRFGLLG